MLFWTLQILITVFGILAILLLSLKCKIRKWGFVSGLISDVFWVIFVIHVGQYVFLIFTTARVLCYLNGVRNYFIKKDTENETISNES
jgi:hypothetical protein